MPTHESLILSCIDALRETDTATLQRLIADRAIFHFPGQSRFAGDYTGNKTIVDFWKTHLHELAGDPAQLLVEDVRAVGEQIIVLITLRAQRATETYEWQSTFLFFVAGSQIAEWWCELGDRRTFDAFWAYKPALSVPDR